jgi:hypothetical protein
MGEKMERRGIIGDGKNRGSIRTPEGAVVGAREEETGCTPTEKEGGGRRRSTRRKSGTALTADHLGISGGSVKEGR